MNGYPNPVETRVVKLFFELGNINPKTVFNASISTRASADYEFYSQTQRKPLPGSARIVRKYASLYNGFSGYTGGAVSGYSDPGVLEGVLGVIGL